MWRVPTMSPQKSCFMYWRIHKKHFIMILLECVSYDANDVASFQPHVYIVLDQVKPDIVLTSSKADETFLDAVSDHSASDLQLMWLYASYLSNSPVDSASGTFQIRPFKEFMKSKGRDRLLSLSRLTDFSTDTDLPPSSDNDSNSSRPANAYDFMRSRREANGDPTTKRWNASIRLANFASVEESPLCVGCILMSL
jgi:DNA mismatch repair protein MSH5